MRHMGLLAAVPLSLIGVSGSAAEPPKVAVYESETNAAEYHGAYQGQLREWLGRQGYALDVIGDEAAADPERLRAYAAVATSSCYLVPDAACSGLAAYVATGGNLLWIDGPARCRNQDLLRTLGIEGEYTYIGTREGQFGVVEADAPALAGIASFTAPAAGNPAVKATGRVLVTWTPAGAEGISFPAVITNRVGKGRATLINWIIWLSTDDARRILTGVLDWSLARALLGERPCLVWLGEVPEEVAQPQDITLSARVFARPGLAGKTGSLRGQLLQRDRNGRGQPVVAAVTLKPAVEDDLAFGAAEMALSTEGLPDGPYTVSVAGEVGGESVAAQASVTLNAEALARQEREQAARCAMLRAAMGTILGDYDAEPRTPEGRVDIPRLLTQIEAAHMTMYDFLIWHAETDWDDLQLLLPEARKRGLKVWVTLAPPAEAPPSAPFGLDFHRWAEEIGKLSRRYDNLVAVVIDDFASDLPPGIFSPSYIAEFAATLRKHNPKVAFLPTLYWGTIGNADLIKRYGPQIDGIVFPYEELESTESLRAQLEACRKWLGPNRLLYINVYASGSSGRGEKGPRTPEYMRSILTISPELCDGIRIYCLPKSDFTDPRFAITAELYAKWLEGR